MSNSYQSPRRLEDRTGELNCEGAETLSPTPIVVNGHVRGSEAVQAGSPEVRLDEQRRIFWALVYAHADWLVRPEHFASLCRMARRIAGESA